MRSLMRAAPSLLALIPFTIVAIAFADAPAQPPSVAHTADEQTVEAAFRNWRFANEMTLAHIAVTRKERSPNCALRPGCVHREVIEADVVVFNRSTWKCERRKANVQTG